MITKNDYDQMTASQKTAALKAHDRSKQALSIVSVNVKTHEVFFRTSVKSFTCHDTFFAYNHQTKRLFFCDPSALFPREHKYGNEDDQAPMFFSVGCNDHLASCISANIYRHYSIVDGSESYCELTALEKIDTLIVDI